MLLTNWLGNLTSRILKRPVYRSRERRSLRRRWQAVVNNQIVAAESLEDRTLLTTFTVENLDASGTGSLADAIDQANANAGLDTIVFQTGLAGIIYTADTLLIEDDIIIDGDSDNDVYTKDITINGGQDHALFLVDNVDATFSNLRLSFGQGNQAAASQSGGAIAMLGSASRPLLTLNDMTFYGNEADYGGAISVHNAGLLVEDTTFQGNHAIAVNGSGGAINIYNDINDGTIFNIARSAFYTNRTTGGGVSGTGGGGAIAFESNGGTLNITDSHFHINTVTGGTGGGAISASAFPVGAGGALSTVNTTLNVTDSNFVENEASTSSGFAFGGAILADSGDANNTMTTTIVGSSFGENTVSNNGGGGAVAFSGAGDMGPGGPGPGGVFINTAIIQNSTFYENSAEYGGAVYSTNTDLSVDSATITKNTASGSYPGIESQASGGIAVFSSNEMGVLGGLQIQNSILDENSGPQIRSFSEFVAPVISLGNNLINGDIVDTPGFVFDSSDITGTSADLGELKRNGKFAGVPYVVGSNSGTFTPNAGSPVIDQGATSLAFDQFGVARPKGAADDIGAVEVLPSVVYVDDSFSNPIVGQDPDGVGGATEFGYDAFASIQEAINNVADFGTILIADGTYTGDVDTTLDGKRTSFSFGNPTAKVTINGNMILGFGDALQFQIGGNVPGTSYDQLVVNGSILFPSAYIDISSSLYAPVEGDQFILIQNDGLNPIEEKFYLNGTPTILTEGYEFTDFLGVPGQSAFLTYKGGDGNDLAIVVQDTTPQFSLPSNGNADQYTLKVIGENVLISDDTTGNLLYNVPLSALGGPLVIDGEPDQDDTLTIDLTGIDDTTPLQVVFNGGSGGNDAINLTGGDLVTMNYYFDSANDGRIALNTPMNEFLTYTGLEPITSSVDSDNVVLYYGDSSETITITDAGGGMTTVDSTAGEMLTFIDPTDVLLLNAGGGDDIINIDSLAANYSGELRIVGGDDDDILNVNTSLSLSADKYLLLTAEDINLNGGSITTNGYVWQSYHGDVTLGADTVINNTGGEGIYFDFTVNGSHSLDVTSDGFVVFYDDVTVNELTVNAGTVAGQLSGSINTGSGDVEMTAGENIAITNITTSGEVRLTAVTGAIADNSADESSNINADRAVLRAGTDIGGYTDDTLETSVNTLAASVANGNIEIVNTGALEIGTVDSLDGVTATNGDVIITAASPLTVNQTISGDSVTLTTVDSAAAGDNVTINADINSTVSNITLNSGDDFTLSALATLTATTTININVDPSAGDPDTAGSTVDLLGDVSATGTTITGGDDADSFNITPSANSPVSVVGGNPSVSPGDTLTYLTPTGETTTFTPIDSDGGTISVTGGSADVTFDEIENLTLSGASSLVVYGTFNSDVLTITASNSNSGTYQFDGGPVVHFENITDFTFNGEGNPDRLYIVNPTGGVFDPVNGVTYNANTGTIQILGGAATTVEHRMTSSTNGSLFYDGESTATINYNGVGSVFAVNDQVSVTDRILTYNTGDEDFIISDGEFAVSTTVDSDGGPSVSFSSPTGSLTINTTVGDDTLTFYDLALDFDADLNINGGTVEFIRDLDFNSGDLNLDVDSVEIAAALSTTGNVNIQATNEIQMLASSFVGSINAGAGDINLTGGWIQLRSLTTTGNVSLTATTTAIYDSNGAGVNITADQVALRSVTGSEGLEINANTLAASADTGNMSFVNSGDLIIGTVDGLSGLTAINGYVDVHANGALTVNDAVYALDAVDLTILDTSNSGEDLTINADVTSNSAIVTLSAADILTIATGSTVSGGEVQMLIDAGLPGTNDPAGGTANINGTLLGFILELRGGNNDDTVIIDSNGGTNDDGGTLDAFDFPFTFYGFLGFDSFILDDSGDTTGDTIEIQDLAPGSGLIKGLASPGVDFTYNSGVDQVTLATGSGADDITLTPNTVTAFNILGGAPTMAPGDTLTYVTPSGEIGLLTPDGPDGGTITILDDMVGYQAVVFDEIETALVTGNLTIEGTAGDDELIITATSANSGTYQLNGGAIIAFSNLDELIFNGLDGDDRMVINNPTGGLFNPVDGVIFNGGTGGETNGDTLEILGGTAGTVEHRFVNENEGAIHYDGQLNATIVYTGLEPIIDTIEATSREFHYSDSSETITLTDAGSGQSTIDSTAGELVIFVNPTSFLQIFSGGGSDIINIDSLEMVPAAPIGLEIDAGEGNDTINVGSNIVEGPFSITGSLTLKGGEGDDTFNLDSLAADLNMNLSINGQDGANDIVNVGSPVSLTATTPVTFNTETINLSGGSITSAGGQYYSGNVVLGDDTIIDAGDQLFLEGTVSGAFSLNISAANHLAILGDITTDGLTANSDGIFNMISTVIIDAGAGDIALTSQTSFAIASLITTGDVYITSAGNIADQNGSLMNIVANRAVLRAQGAIEDYGQEVETQVNLLAASATGEIFIKNTGALELGSFDGLSGVSSTNNFVSIESSGAITVTEDVTGNSIDFKAAIVNLDADLDSSTITGNATNVNVLGSTGGAEIQDAVDLSVAGGTVQIAAGTYTPSSTITVTNALTIQGAQAGVDPRPGTGSLRDETDDTTETIIDGSGSLSRIFLIDANDVTLDGLVITNGTGDLVRSSNPVDNITVQYNIIYNSTGDEGVQLANAGNSTIQYNYIFDIEGDGANFDTASNSSIRFNEMRNIRSTNAAIFVDDSEAITIEGNYLDLGHLNNNDGIKVNDFSGTYNTQTSYIINNTVIDSLQDGITIGRSNVVVSGNDVSGSSSNNGVIYVSETVDNVEITNNLIHDNFAAVSGTDTNYAIRIGKNPSDFPTNVIVRDNSIVNNDGLIFFAQNSQANLDALRNWWGTTDASVIAAGIVGVMDGGGNTNGSIDFSTILTSGADTDGVTPGFQPDTSSLSVHDFGSEPATGSRIQNALDLLDDSGTLFIQSGTYTENVDTTATGTDMSVTLAPGNSPGQVTINGNLTLNADDVLDLELNGTAAGTGFDQLIVNGTLNLGSASLNLIDGFDPAEGDQFLLLANDGTDPVVGTFAGLAEGYEFTDFLGVIGQSAFLTYLGGDGNDVAIIVEDSTPQITLPVNSQSNNYRLELSGSHLVLTDVDSGEVIYNVPMNALGGPFVIEGEPDEDDTLIVDMTGIDENTPLQIIFNGGAGGNDTLAFEGGSLSSMEYFFTNASDGGVQLNGSGTNFLTYTGLEPITSTVNATNVTLNYGADSETITVTDAGGGQTTVNSTSGEVLTFFNPTGTLTINAGAGDDIVNVDSLDPAFAANIIINGEADDDTVNLANGLNLGSGDVTISTEVVNVNGIVTTTGNLDFNAGDTIVFAPAGALSTPGNIDLEAVNNIELGAVTTTADVTLTSTAGAIIDANSGSVNITSGGTTTLSAATGVGVGDTLETSLNFLEGNISGGLELAEADGITIGNTGGLNGITVSGNTTITSGAGFVVNENLAVTGGALQLSNAGGNFDVGFGAVISNDGSNLIEINSAGLLVMTDTGTEITSSGNGTIDLDAAVHILLTNVNTSGEVQVTAAIGQIFDNTASEASPIISATTTALRATGNIGAAGVGDLELDVTTMAAASAVGNIFLQESSTANVYIVDGLSGITAAGNISLHSVGSLGLSTGVEATNAGSSILIDTQGNFSINAAVQTNGGAIDLRADNNLYLDVNSDVNTTSAAAITIVANDDGSGVEFLRQSEGSIVNANGGVIDVMSTGDARIANLQSIGGTVLIESTSGAIVDNTTTEDALITAASAYLEAGISVGTSGVVTVIDTEVSTLAGRAHNGNFRVRNSGDLTIGTVSGYPAGVASNDGYLDIETYGSLTVVDNVSSTNSIYLQTFDSSSAGQDVNIEAGVSVSSLNGSISLIAGDDLTIDPAAVLDASNSGINLFVDYANTDFSGGIANLNGTLVASTNINVFGNSDNDQFIIDGNGGALNDGGTVDGVTGMLNFEGGGGSDALILDDSGDVSGDTININSMLSGSGVISGAGVDVDYEELEFVTLYAGSGADDITVSPNALTVIHIVGGDPTMSPGDVLKYTAPPGESSALSPIDPSSGSIATTGGFANITYAEIETQIELTASPDLTVNGTAADDVLTINATGADSGTYQLNSGPVIAFSGITSFTYNGLNGDDTLIINNPAGGLFDPVNGINFNGGTGGETLGDTLQILGGTAAIVEHQFVNNNDGSVFFNGEGTATITYTGLEPIDDTITATNRIFTFTGAAEIITLSDDAGPGDGLSLIDSDLGESVNFIHPIATLTINTELSGGSGADTINIDPLDSTFTANLTVNAGTDDTINTGAVDIGAGALDLAAGQVNVNGAFTTTGSVDIEATAADITFGAAGSIDAGASEIDLTAFFNVESLNVTTTSEVRVTATGGGINDLTGNALITADRAALRVGGPGGITGIDTNVNTLATSVAGGGFTIDNTGALEIGTVDGLAGITAAASSIFLTTTGTLLVSDTVTGGAVDLRSNDTMTISDNVSASTGTLKLENFGGDFVLNSPAQISNAAAFLIDIDSAGAVNLADGSLITSLGTGLIDIDAVNNIALANLNTSGEVQITTSAGAITDNSGSEASLITANTAALRAATGIGSAGAGDIDLAINTMSADTTAGDIYLQELNGGSIATVDGLSGVTASGDISLVIGGTLNVAQAIEATGAGSTILVDSQGVIGVGAAVQTNGGDIELRADSTLILNGPALVDTTSAAGITLVADDNGAGGENFIQNDGSVVNAYGGTIDVSSTGNASIVNLQSAGGVVYIESLSGAIQDNSGGEAALVTANELALRAAIGIGGAGAADFDTAVARVAAGSPLGSIVVSNTGALEIGTVDGLVGIDAGAGNITVSASSPLTVASNVTAAGTVSLTSTDTAGPGDDLTINAGVTVQSTGADVVLNSGDDFLLSLTGEVIAATTITINIDPITDGAGATVDLLGNVNATQTTINGGDDSDIFNILPTVDSPITVNGGDPTLPGPGDVLNLDFSGLAAAPALTLGGDPGSGQFSFLAPDTEQAVNYTSIEDVNTNGSGSYHLVLDMFFSGFEDASDDTIDVGLDAGGTNLLIDINGSNFFTGNDADILSFTVLGSADDDTLNINETAGGLPFFATAAPAGIPGSNGAHLNLAAETFLEDEFNPNTYDVNDITIHYDGKNGTDAINVNFITDHNAGYFSDTIDGLGSGNIGAAAVGDTDIDLGLSFGNVEGVGFSGAANGGLRVDASSTSATTGLNINDDGTPADGVSQITGNGGFTALVFEGFNELQVVSGTGAELIDLIALDSTTTLTSVELDADDVFAADDVSNDTIRVRSTPAGVTSVSLLGGLGDDLFQIFDAGSTVDNIFAALTVDGEGGNDTLTVIDSGDATGDTFEVTSTTIDGISSSAGTDVTFANIDDLNVTGTAGDDTINVNLGAQEDLDTVTINGAGGDDDFNLQNSTPMGVNTLLNGQAGNDEFFFDSNYVLRGFINGGGDIDTIDYTTYSNAVHVQLAGLGSLDGFQGYELNGSILGTGGGGTGFDNINDLVGSANSDTLEGPNLNNYWGVTSTDEGFIIAERNNLTIGRPTIAGDAIATPPEERLDFTDFQNLIGGTQDDRFDLSDGAGLTGTLDGDTGNDSLDYRDYTTGVTVDLFAGTATNIGGGLVAGTGGGDDDNSIENVFGGDGNDNITGDNDHNILGDGLGSDFLDGGGYGVGSGNGGNDVFLMEPGNGGSADVITDIHGNDTIDFRFASAGIVFDVDIINTPQDVFGTNTIELRQLQPEQPDTNPSFMENVVGSEFDDYIFIDPLSQDGNFPIDGPPVLRSADGRGGYDILDFDAKGQAVIDTGYSLTADGVGTVQYLNFEEVTPFEDNPATIVDNGDLGFSLSGDWPYHPAGTAAITTGVGYEDDIHTVQSQLVDPVHYGDAAAFWEFYGLTPGVYRVSVTWPASENPFVIPQMASDAPFTVFDGSRNDITTTAINLGTFDLNQQVAPDDFQADGALWEDLGTFTVNSRTLTVMLTNLANGLITADAVRIERVSAGPEVQLTDVTDAPAPPSVLVDGHPGGIDFGTTELLTDLTRTFEITNTGSAALDISNIVIPAGFTTTLTAQSVAAGDTISFEITMDSDSFGDRSGLFSFDTNDVDEATFNLLLHGQVSNVVIIDNGDADFSATAGFELYDSGVNRGSAGFEGDIAGAIPNQPGFIPPPAGTDTATWTFTGLANGFYRVSTTWSALYNRVTDAPYTVTSGGNISTLDVDQTLIPSSFADNGAAWFDLNTFFEVVDGTLTVTLTNDASSIPRDTFDLANGVIADAVRIEYLPTPDLEVTVDGDVVDDDTGVVDFGTTIPGIPVIKTFTVTNLSADPVDVTGLIEFPPGFSIDPASPFGTDTVPVNIPGGGSVTFTIQFDGGTTGSTFGQISFTTGDADENPYNFTVTGAAGPATVGINDGDFTSTGTWNEHIPGVVGDPEFLYTGVPYVGGSGANEASWEFDVEPGRYQIVAHWYVHPDVSPYGRAAATNAPYTIFSDATPVDTFRVSHQTSSNDFLDDGTWWEYIGDPVVIDGNTLTVMLSDDADGIVYADEIRIIRVVDPVIKVEVDGGTVEDSGAVDFEDTITGAPVVKTFTVTNFGERNMALGGINVPTGFSLVSGFGSTNLAPGASTTFTLQMDASIGGSFSGMVSFGGDLAVENPFNFTVSGSAADSMIIDNGDSGYSTSGAAWNEQVWTFGDDTLYFQRDQDVLLGGDLPGVNTATWTFENLGAGTYQVASHWLNHSGYASNAQITIAGIEGGPITVTLDQRFYPQGFSADGSIWQELGNFQVAAGNTLTVTISDDGANGNLAADAMRLELLTPGSTAPEIDVAAGATALTSGVSGVDLGTAFFGETLSQTFTITNTGTNTLNLGAITLPGSGEYTVSSPLGTTTLFAGQSTTFEISFNSTGAAGVVAGPVSIVTNDSDENPFTFNITAEMTDVVLIDNGDVGYSSTGSWTNLLYDPRYFESDAQRLNLGQSGTATWDFTNLTAGTYTVSATWLNDPLRATNAEYNVAGVGPVVVDQQVAPNDFAADGFNWEILTAAVVVAPGGSITVTLSDNGPADGAINADAIRIQRVGPLMAAAGVSSTAAPSITQSDLDSVVDAALSYWETAGLSDAQLELLGSVNFVLTDLPDAMLGGASGTTVLIDVNAAGYGWFVDGTPLDSSEFTLLDGSLLAGSGSDAFGQMDLLTVVMHELGHTLGLEDLESDGTLMSESLDVSERRLPSADDLDDFFSGIAGGDNPLLD
ncbi:hypothetical protein V6x_32680 [Gimesia chilikensis]|uniref:Uncharacterized protein n=4 Tax=Gimesia chilikensis TaxID=2605989 RepID=A0A517WE77_9PLAN|nr:choice-of-anchor D domain-containing protein [Gimesia chilikensis]QDU03547.1 hypothetical protein V6x_32680 [Gimesia chilikensis]